MAESTAFNSPPGEKGGAKRVRRARLGSSLDSYDRRILAAILRGPPPTFEELGRLAFLSTAQAYRRLKRLRALGVVGPRVFVFDPAKLGLKMSAWLDIDLSGCDETTRTQACEAVSSTLGVVECLATDGGALIAARVMAMDGEQLDRVLEKIRSVLPAPTRVVAYPIGRIVKSAPWPIVD